MLGKRAITLKIERPKLDETSGEGVEVKTFEEKAELVLEIVERVALKAFIGLCIYVVFDTYRQTSVARASHD